MGKMRFGLFVPQGWRLDLVGVAPEDQWETMHNFAKRIDDRREFESIWVYDHLHTTPVPTDEACHEAWTLMAALAASTNRVRLGQMCTCMSYRNPAYLAKVASTTDVISGGRVEMGIGAGWYEHEWRAYGYGFPSAGERLARLDEGIEIMRQLWTHGHATFKGEHYQVEGAISRPLPLQDGGIPLWVAGGGEKVTLRIAAKNARRADGKDDLASFTAYTNFGGILDVFRHKSEVLARHCRDLGTDFDSIARTSNYNVILGETVAEAEDKLARIASTYGRFTNQAATDVDFKAFRNSPAFGTPEQVVENLTALYEAGMTYAICYFPLPLQDPGSIELFEKQVIPALP
jgi:F420-dependent oxidoreductase-like protein